MKINKFYFFYLNYLNFFFIFVYNKIYFFIFVYNKIYLFIYLFIYYLYRMKKQTNKKKYNKIKITKKKRNVNNLNKKGGGPVLSMFSRQTNNNLQEAFNKSLKVNGQVQPLTQKSKNTLSPLSRNQIISAWKKNNPELSNFSNETIVKISNSRLNENTNTKSINSWVNVSSNINNYPNNKLPIQKINIPKNNKPKNNKPKFNKPKTNKPKSKNAIIQKYRKENPRSNLTNHEILQIENENKDIIKLGELGDKYIDNKNLAAIESGKAGDCFYESLYNTLLYMSEFIPDIFEGFKNALLNILEINELDINLDQNFFVQSIRNYIANIINKYSILYYMSQKHKYGIDINVLKPLGMEEKVEEIKKDMLYYSLFNLENTITKELKSSQPNFTDKDLQDSINDMYKLLLADNFRVILKSAPTYDKFKEVFTTEDLFNFEIAINTNTMGEYANNIHIDILNFCLSHSKLEIEPFTDLQINNNDSQTVITIIKNKFRHSGTIIIPIYKLNLSHFAAIQLKRNLFE